MTTPDDGARALLERLAAHGAAKTSPAEFERLMEGIAAAPESLSGPEWLELVAPYVGEQGADDLLALRARLAAQPDGIADVIPPRARLDALRAELQRRGLDGFIVPRADEHQGEYVPRAALRLAWLTGFSGSAGWAIVLADKGAIFVDGRYTLQVRDQVDTTLFQPQAYPETTPADWLASNLASGRCRPPGASLHQGRRHAGRCRRQSHRCRMARSSAATAGTGIAPAARPGR